MRLRRDTYHDYATAEEIVNCGGHEEADDFVRRVEVNLTHRSGILDVKNWSVIKEYDMNAMAWRYRVSFDSRAWTGRA
jgi:hypothetical protein